MLVLACFDIEDDKTRRQVGHLLGGYGDRVQRSVFEVLFKNPQECKKVFDDLMNIIDDGDDLRFYPLCKRCADKAVGSIENPGDLNRPLVI
ncbi:CRISPR-associated endonuclease Cas2 [Vibrio alfacsensis]|uniref:CRISPR-associated endonuclease Cas2 n=1 Tax=Vibrio alfacsensis TaxID=1074311 RepID=UPI0019D2EFBA|nr:CRISPR-associated endonuclease Cas2 [Vibrio alfacsensis]